MTDQNRWSESGSARAAQEERRYRQDEWRREHPSERDFGRDDPYVRGSRSYSGEQEYEGRQRHGGANYGGQRGYTGQDYGSEPYAYVGQSHGNQVREGHLQHRGKGPKGYQRSDHRIREDVCDRLSDDDELDASEITVTVKDGEVTLEGTVTDRRAKSRAEDLAESVGGVRDVNNKLRKNNGLLQEIGERLTSSQSNERGYAGSGTKNTSPNDSVVG